MFRMQLYDIVITRRFDYMMFGFIVISCVQMMLESPKMDHHSTEYQVLWYLACAAQQTAQVPVAL